MSLVILYEFKTGLLHTSVNVCVQQHLGDSVSFHHFVVASIDVSLASLG